MKCTYPVRLYKRLSEGQHFAHGDEHKVHLVYCAKNTNLVPGVFGALP